MLAEFVRKNVFHYIAKVNESFSQEGGLIDTEVKNDIVKMFDECYKNQRKIEDLSLIKVQGKIIGQ